MVKSWKRSAKGIETVEGCMAMEDFCAHKSGFIFFVIYFICLFLFYLLCFLNSLWFPLCYIWSSNQHGIGTNQISWLSRSDVHWWSLAHCVAERYSCVVAVWFDWLLYFFFASFHFFFLLSVFFSVFSGGKQSETLGSQLWTFAAFGGAGHALETWMFVSAGRREPWNLTPA